MTEHVLEQSDRATQLAVSAPGPLSGEASVLDKLADRKALEALDGILAGAQAGGSLPPGARAGIAMHAKATADDAVAAAERMQRHVSAIDAVPHRSKAL